METSIKASNEAEEDEKERMKKKIMHRKENDDL